jgi:shikimate kinase
MTTSTPRIIITGFMAAGKTTVARSLAAQLRCAWLDLDDLIFARTGRSVPAIIDEDGEARFRELETDALRAALASEAQVIALGGGAWTLARNRALVAQAGCVAVWLDAPFDLCWRRITQTDADARPFARDPAQTRQLYESRRGSYRLSTLRVPVAADAAAAELAREIAARLGRA